MIRADTCLFEHVVTRVVWFVLLVSLSSCDRDVVRTSLKAQVNK